jgi:hypothetical protein
MLRTASSLPLTGLSTLGSGPARFPAEPPACYRASWQLPGPDFHRQATTSLRTRRSTMHYVTVSPPVLLGARIIEASGARISPGTALPGEIRAFGSRFICVIVDKTRSAAATAPAHGHPHHSASGVEPESIKSALEGRTL